MVNLLFGWCWILVGLLVGAAIGLFFHRDDWQGGYGSWRRRMMRLGHIAFLGTGMLNILYGLSQAEIVDHGPLRFWGGGALIGGAVAMPMVCFASAAWKPMRHLFALPVVLLITGVVILICELAMKGA